MKTPCRLSLGSWQFRDRGFSGSLSLSQDPASARGGGPLALTFEALLRSDNQALIPAWRPAWSWKKHDANLVTHHVQYDDI